MSNVLFVRPRHVYESYSDLYRLIELAGYPLIYPDELQPDSDNTYIVTIFSGETQNGWPNAKARIVLFDLEWHTHLPIIPGVNEVWAADAFYAQRIGARYVPLGSDCRLNPEPDAPRTEQYDVALLAYMGPPRRQEVQYGLHRHGITQMPNAWGDERHKGLLSTRAMCHIHQLDEFPCVAAQRFCLSAAYKLPLFSETLEDGGIFSVSNVLMSDKRYYAAFVSMWLADKSQRLNDYGHALHQLLCVDHTFKKEIERAL